MNTILYCFTCAVHIYFQFLYYCGVDWIRLAQDTTSGELS
jgi:hypothetical protein